MALLFMDSFDHYVTADLLKKWTYHSGASIVAGIGRNGTSGLRLNGSGSNVMKGVPAAATLIVGGACKATQSLDRWLMQLGDSSVVHAGIYVHLDGSLSVARCPTSSTGWAGAPPAAFLCTSVAGLMPLNTYVHIQLKVTIGDAPTGSCELRVNGVLAASASGVDTRAGGGATASAVYFGNYTDVDDLWVCDDTGPAPWNGFLGDCRVDTRLPTGAGATTGWTPSTGANWAAVDEALQNEDADYTSTVTVGAIDTFVTQDAPVVGMQIYGVQQCIATRKSDVGACTLAGVIRVDGRNYEGVVKAVGTTYAYQLQVSAQNPGGGGVDIPAPWTEASFNAAEFGYKRTV